MLPLFLSNAIRKIRKKKYNTIIAFQEGFPTCFVSKIQAENKIAWIHSNYEEYMKLTKKDELAIYEKFNHIVCVSKFTMEVFINFYPQLKPKTQFIHNTVDTNYIKRESQEKINDPNFDNNLFTIISLGRIDPIKQFSKLPEIAAKIKQKNIKFKWFLLGDGNQNELDLILKNTKTYDVEDCFIYLGSKYNPYPYIAKSNILVSSSLSEACPYVVNEAKILGVPVVSTDYGSSYEFIEDQISGYITTLEQMPNTICQLMDNYNIYNQIKGNLGTFVYDNDVIVRQIVKIL